MEKQKIYSAEEAYDLSIEKSKNTGEELKDDIKLNDINIVMSEVEKAINRCCTCCNIFTPMTYNLIERLKKLNYTVVKVHYECYIIAW